MRRLPRSRVPARARRLVAATAIAIAVSSLGALAVGAQPVRRGVATLDARARDELRTLIRRSLDSAGVASITVAVARDGAVLWEEGFGFADLASRRPATPTTRYAIASIGKPMTATAVMQLVEQGRIDLDRPVDDYFGSMRLAGPGGDRAHASTARAQPHQRTAPPLSILLSEQDGAAGCRATTIGTGARLANSALRYDAAHNLIPHYDVDHRAASAVFASAHDLVRFGIFQLKQRPAKASAGWAPPITHSTIDRMQRVATPGDTSGGYGFGWAIDHEFGVRRVRHTGSMPGGSAVLALYPDDRLAIAVLSNQHSALPARIASWIASATIRGAPDSDRVRASVPASSVDRFTAPDALRGEWRGALHTHERIVPIAMRVDSSRVLVRLGDEATPWTPLASPNFRHQLLGGQFIGTIPTLDARQMTHVIVISLRLHEERLRGWAAAYFTAESDDFALSSFAELARVPLDERAR